MATSISRVDDGQNDCDHRGGAGDVTITRDTAPASGASLCSAETDMIEGRLNPDDVVLDGNDEFLHDSMFGRHGWYDLKRKPSGAPGEELRVAFRPFTEDELAELRTCGLGRD